MLSKLRSAPAALAVWLGIRRQRGTRILLYHGTPRRDAAPLERQLGFLRRCFRVVPLEDVLTQRAVDGSIALTFDDGLRNNIQVAYPLLKRLGLHATFFVCPGLIDRGGWLWNHEARQRLKHAGEAADKVVEWMKTLPLSTRRDVEADIRRTTPGFTPTPQERGDWDLATWEELRALDPRVVSIGSHTLTHPILPLSSPQEIEAELAQSRARLEGELQRPVETFAYPNGAYDDVVHRYVRKHYRMAVAVEGGALTPQCDPHLLPRLAAPKGALRLAKRIGSSPIS